MNLPDSSSFTLWRTSEIVPASGDAQLVTAAVLGFAVVILLIAMAKVHPFLSLVFGALVLGVVAGLGPEVTITSFSGGVGTTVGGVGLLIAVGAMIGGLLAESGGADRSIGCRGPWPEWPR